MTIHKQLIHTPVCINPLMVDNAAQSTLWYQLNARESVDRDEPYGSLYNYTLAVVSTSNRWHALEYAGPPMIPY